MALPYTAGPSQTQRLRVIWTPRSLPPRLYGTPRFGSILAGSPRSLPLLPDSNVWGNPSPFSSTDSNYMAQNLSPGSIHLVHSHQMSPTQAGTDENREIASQRSDGNRGGSVEGADWDRRVRRKNSWDDEEFLNPLESSEQTARLVRQINRMIEETTGGRHADSEVVRADGTLGDMHSARGGTTIRLPATTMTIHEVDTPAPLENQHHSLVNTWLDQTFDGPSLIAVSDTETADNEIVLAHPANELPDFNIASSSYIQPLEEANEAALRMNSPAKSNMGDSQRNRPHSSLRPTAPTFSPAELGAWPNSPSSFSPSPILPQSTVEVPPVSPAETQARDARLQSSSGYSPNDSEMQVLHSSTAASLGPSPSSLTSYQTTQPAATPENSLVHIGHRGMSNEITVTSPFGNFTNDFMRALPIAPRAMLQPRTLVHPSATSYTNSRTWLSDEHQKRTEFARLQERARFMAPEEARCLPQTFEEYLLSEVRQKESQIREMQKKIEAKEKETASKQQTNEMSHALQPLHQMSGPIFSNSIQAGPSSSMMGTGNSFNVNNVMIQHNATLTPASRFNNEGDLRTRRGLQNRLLPPPGFNPVDARPAHLQLANIGNDSIPFQAVQRSSSSRWNFQRAVEHDTTQSQETDVQGTPRPNGTLLRTINNWINDIDDDE